MTHTYNVSGMTCSGCQAKVQGLLSKVPEVKRVDIDLEHGQATIEMNRHIATSELQAALKDYPKYQLTGIPYEPHQPTTHETHSSTADEEAPKSWLSTYKPILLIATYITVVTLMTANGDLMRWMPQFMAAFFLTFSFFKMLDLAAFADSYSMYDIIAGRWRGWGFIYPFVEAALGVAYLAGFNPLITNAAAFIIMSLSIIGVLRSVLNKRKIKCACLGAVFNLPMSTITIIEDGLMIAMSAYSLIGLSFSS